VRHTHLALEHTARVGLQALATRHLTQGFTTKVTAPLPHVIQTARGAPSVMPYRSRSVCDVMFFQRCSTDTGRAAEPLTINRS
jgi:hypothetical protein